MEEVQCVDSRCHMILQAETLLAEISFWLYFRQTTLQDIARSWEYTRLVDGHSIFVMLVNWQSAKSVKASCYYRI